MPSSRKMRNGITKANSTTLWPSSPWSLDRPLMWFGVFISGETGEPPPARGGGSAEVRSRLRPGGDRGRDLPDRGTDRGAEPAPSDSQQHADDDHGEDERVLDKGLTLVALELGDPTDESGRPSVETIHHEVVPLCVARAT